MNAVPVTAMFLAAALLAAPSPPSLRMRVRRHRSPSRGIPVVLALVAGAIMVARLLSPDVVGIAAAATGVAVLRRRRGRTAVAARGEGNAMAAALEILVGELRTGAHPVQAFSAAAGESNGAVAQALRLVASRARLGADVGAGFRAVAATSAVPAYWTRVEVCWNLAAQHGLAMSAMMSTARRDIVERQRFGDRTRAGLAGARATAAILAALPVLGVLLGQVIGARPLALLFGGGLGRWLLIVGLALVGAGVAWSDHIIDGVTR